jgi:hypothetical protein
VDAPDAGYDIAEKMGLILRIRDLGYQGREVRLVDGCGRMYGGFSVDVFRRLIHDRFTTVRRSDLATTIYRALEGRVETIFGDSVARIEEAEHVDWRGKHHTTAWESGPPWSLRK